MALAQNIFPAWRRAELALDFGAETITLLAEDATASQGWTALAHATLTDEDFGQQIEVLRTTAEEKSKDCRVDLWLPADQILNTHLALEGSKPWNRRGAAELAIAERTSLTPEEINLDLAPAPNGLWAACAVDANVVSEAKDYAIKWGFTPVIATTRHADGAFVMPPDLSGQRRVKPALIAGGAIAAAAGIAALAFLLPAAETPELETGPNRIALSPAAALTAPLTAHSDDGAALRHGGSDDIVLKTKPSAPRPDHDFGEASSDEDYNFAAALKSPVLALGAVRGMDFTMPPPGNGAPTLANIAYTSPATRFALPVIDDIVLAPLDNEPVVDVNDLPSLSAATTPSDEDAITPKLLEEFTIAALGESPLAQTTQELLLQEDAVTPPDEVSEANQPAEDRVEDSQEPAQVNPDAAANTTDPTTTDQPEVAAETPITPDDPETATAAAEQAAEAEAEEAPGPGSVASAPRPGKRPDSLDFSPGPGSVAAAPAATSRPKSIKPKAVTVARNTSSAKTVRAPTRSKPTGPGLANAATLRNAFSLDQTSLLGVFGTSKNRRALLRMSDGRMKRVSQGEVIDGWVISRIQANSMRMTRGSEVRNLNLIR